MFDVSDTSWVFELLERIVRLCDNCRLGAHATSGDVVVCEKGIFSYSQSVSKEPIFCIIFPKIEPLRLSNK